MFSELPSDLLIFIYTRFELKCFLHYKHYKFPTEVFVVIFWFKLLVFLMYIRLLECHIHTVSGENLKPSL
jgi:hypothetical protein